MKFYVYALVDPAKDSDIRYIGYTSQSLSRRLSGHLRSTGHTHKENWIRAVLADGRVPAIKVIASADTLDDALAMERHFIRLHRSNGSPLTNTTEGGEGHLGYSPSAVTRQKLSAAGKGRKHSAKTRLKMSINNAMRLRQDVRDRMAAALRGRFVSEETRARQSAVRAGRTITPTWRERLRVSSRLACSTTEARRRLSTSATIGNHNRWHLAKGVKKEGCALCA